MSGLDGARLGIVLSAVAACLAGGALATVATASAGEGPTALAAAASGSVLGGRTSQGLPVVVELARSARRLALATTALRLTCTSGGIAVAPDGYAKLAVSGSGRFSSSWGPQTERNADGTTTDYQGAIAGRLSKGRTKASGTWQLKWIDHDSTGAVTDTCDSGTVSWSAKD